MTSTSRPFPGFEHLYWFSDVEQHFRGQIEWPGNVPDAVERWARLTAGEERPSEVIEIRWAMGRRVPADVIHTTNAYPLAVHKRMIDLLLDYRFTGWATYPVRVFGKDGEEIPDYVGFSLTGRCGPLIGKRSRVETREFRGRPQKLWIGLCFDEKTWDGSDFFIPAGTLFEFVTEPVVRAFRKARITGVKFEIISEVERNWDPDESHSKSEI